MSNTNAGISAKKSIPITIGDKTYVIEKMPLGKYVELLGVMESLPAKLMEMFPDKQWDEIATNLESMDMNAMLQALPRLMKYAATEIIGIVSTASKIPVDVLRDDPDIGLDVFMDIVLAVVEVNNFSKVQEQIKNVLFLRRIME